MAIANMLSSQLTANFVISCLKAIFNIFQRYNYNIKQSKDSYQQTSSSSRHLKQNLLVLTFKKAKAEPQMTTIHGNMSGSTSQSDDPAAATLERVRPQAASIPLKSTS